MSGPNILKFDSHFVRELIMHNVITTAHVRTKSQLADIFTNAIGASQFSYLLSKLGVHDHHTLT